MYCVLAAFVSITSQGRKEFVLLTYWRKVASRFQFLTRHVPGTFDVQANRHFLFHPIAPRFKDPTPVT